jgi:hypothetical protein
VTHGYLIVDKVDHHIFNFRTVGGQEEYQKATEFLLEGKGDEAHLGRFTTRQSSRDDGGTGSADE